MRAIRFATGALLLCGAVFPARLAAARVPVRAQDAPPRRPRRCRAPA